MKLLNGDTFLAELKRLKQHFFESMKPLSGTQMTICGQLIRSIESGEYDARPSTMLDAGKVLSHLQIILMFRKENYSAVLYDFEAAIKSGNLNAGGELRCINTRNPCGTDTWGNGQKCQCANCQAWIKANAGGEGL